LNDRALALPCPALPIPQKRKKEEKTYVLPIIMHVEDQVVNEYDL
jgi:hypothetical protein